MKPRLDLTGQRFGRLVAIAYVGQANTQSLWACRCDCGTECVKRLGNLRSGKTISCGCQRMTAAHQSRIRHSMFGTPIYRSWSSMLTRCTNQRHHNYPDYGGRGIKVCERWRDFTAFASDMGERPPGTSLGRIDNDGNYEPGNCRWETSKQQGRNRRTTRLVNIDGITTTIQGHCDRLGLNSNTIRSRLYSYGWTIEEAFRTPTPAAQPTTQNGATTA